MKALHLVVLLFVSVCILSCGGKEKKEKIAPIDTKTEQPTTTASAEDEVVEVMLHATDKMTFDLNDIRVNAGDKVRLTLMHTGKMSKAVMGHNFVLLNKGVNMSSFASKAAAAVDNDYIPENSDAVIAHTKLLGGGETDVIEFTAPSKGIYDFLCTFPGHYALMKGKFIVE